MIFNLNLSKIGKIFFLFSIFFLLIYSIYIYADQSNLKNIQIGNTTVISDFESRDYAWNYAGRVVTVEGILKMVFNNQISKACLCFKSPHLGGFKGLILKEHWVNFPQNAPEKLYSVGQKVQITGKITWYQGDPVIYIEKPEQVKIIYDKQ